MSIYDKALKITILNRIANYDVAKDELSYVEKSVTSNRKNGFLFVDELKRCLGIVYRSDDKRTARYDMAEICFFKEYEKELGSWRVVKINGNYLEFNNLEIILSKRNSYDCTIDARFRKNK